MAPMQIGIYTFAEMTPDPRTGSTVSPAQRLRDLLEEIELWPPPRHVPGTSGVYPPQAVADLAAWLRAIGQDDVPYLVIETGSTP